MPGVKYPHLFVALGGAGARRQQRQGRRGAARRARRAWSAEDVTDEELARFKTRAKADLIRSLDSNSGLAEQLVTYQTLTGDWRDIFTYIERTDAVTKADIRRVAAEVFKPGNRTVARLENDAAPAAGRHAMSRLRTGVALAALVLATLTPTLARGPGRHRRPAEVPGACRRSRCPSRRGPCCRTAWWCSSWRTTNCRSSASRRASAPGSLLEPADKVGVASLTGSQMRGGGTQALAPEALDRYLEGRAASIETSIGDDAGSAGMSVLKQDFAEVLQVFSDVLRQPAVRPGAPRGRQARHRGRHRPPERRPERRSPGVSSAS